MGVTTIINALVYDGNSLTENVNVTVDNGLISSIDTKPLVDVSNLNVVDAAGLTLLPGFIDAHVHLGIDAAHAAGLLQDLAKNGVTTALDMGVLPGALKKDLQSRSNVADVRIAGNFATSSGSLHSKLPHIKQENLVDNLELAVRFVEDRVSEGADYIKIVADVPGPSQDVLNELALQARKKGKLSVAHAARAAAFSMAQEAKVDIITHVPLDYPLDEAATRTMQSEHRVCVPTLVMMKKMATVSPVPGLNYQAAKDSVALLHQFGIPIIAGTDANMATMARIKHGESFHDELELLKDAGLSNEDVLRAATSLPAKWFQLEDRGVIAIGKRADLVLVEGNPLENIAATRNIKKIWIGGVEVS